jgi:hypothetical protein
VLVVRLVRVPVSESRDRNHGDAPSLLSGPRRCSIVVVAPGRCRDGPGARGAGAAAGVRTPGRAAAGPNWPPPGPAGPAAGPGASRSAPLKGAAFMRVRRNTSRTTHLRSMHLRCVVLHPRHASQAPRSRCSWAVPVALKNWPLTGRCPPTFMIAGSYGRKSTGTARDHETQLRGLGMKAPVRRDQP